MSIRQVSDTDQSISRRQLILRPPSQGFRFGWLAVGLIAGYIISLFALPGTSLLAVLAAFTGVSANWSP